MTSLPVQTTADNVRPTTGCSDSRSHDSDAKGVVVEETELVVDDPSPSDVDGVASGDVLGVVAAGTVEGDSCDGWINNALTIPANITVVKAAAAIRRGRFCRSGSPSVPCMPR
jgi:hypothetical protein